jgi:hypothetical protein
MTFAVAEFQLLPKILQNTRELVEGPCPFGSLAFHLVPFGDGLLEPKLESLVIAAWRVKLNTCSHFS